MRIRVLVPAVLAALLALPTAANAVNDSTWTREGLDALTADTPGTVTVTATLDDTTGIRADLPLAYRHLLVDGSGTPQEGVTVGWSRGAASGTATVDANGAILFPTSGFTIGGTPGLTGAGDVSELELTLPAGDYGLFSDLVDATPQVVRRAGDNRYATAAEASRTVFPRGVARVYVATGEGFADALSAGPVAAEAGGPLLLVRRDTLPDETRAELKRLQPDEIVLLGGTAVVSEDVERELQPYAGNVLRIAGSDRYDTAGRAAREAWFTNGVGKAYIASGESFADAVAAGARAAVDGVPVLLVREREVPTATQVSLRVLGVSEVVIVGGSRVVGPEVEAALRSDGIAVTRRAGDTRIETSVAVADRAGSGRTLLVATAYDFPDALTAGPLAGYLDADLLLTTKDALPSATAARAEELAPKRVVLLGGTAAVSTAVQSRMADFLTPLDSLELRVVASAGGADFTVS